MLIVSIFKSDEPQLSAAGVPVRINGEPQLIRKVGSTIQWTDPTGTKHVRHLFQIKESADLITFFGENAE